MTNALRALSIRREKTAPSIYTSREAVLTGVIVGIFVLTGLRSSGFLGIRSAASVLNDGVSVGLLAVGVSVVIIAGGIDISVASIFAASAIAAGLLSQNGHPTWVAVGAGVLCGAVLGTCNAVLVVGLRIEPIVATLATFGIFRGVLVEATNEVQINALPSSFTHIGTAKVLDVPIPVWILAGTAVLVGFLMTRTGFGRALYAIGNNESATRKAGTRVDLVRGASYTLSGAIAGLAGVVFLARNGTVLGQTGVGLELSAIAAAVIGGISILGGRGSVVGSALAAVFLATVAAALVTLGVDAKWLDALSGITIIAAIATLAISQRAKERTHG